MSSQTRPETIIDFHKLLSQSPSTERVVPPDEQRERSTSPSRSNPLERATNNSNKRRYGSPKYDGSRTTSAKVLKLPKIHESEASSPRDFREGKGSPWEIYEKVFNLNLNDPVTVAQRKAPLSGLVAVRAFPITVAEKALYMYKRARHDNIVEALDAFTTDISFYIVTEHMPISLEQIVESTKYPTERQLAAILRQIIDGLAYLEDEGLEHGSITCSNILLSSAGDVKIANQQFCDIRQANREPRDVRALSVIMMELMQKYTQEKGLVGVENLNRWPSDSDAVAFLSDTTTAASAHELKKHALFRRPCRNEDLIGLIFLAEVSACRDYSCSA